MKKLIVGFGLLSSLLYASWISTGGSGSGLTSPVGVSDGGTGLTTLTANNVVLGNGTSTPGFVAPSTSGNILTSNGTTWTSAAAAASGGISGGTAGRLTKWTGATTVKESYWSENISTGVLTFANWASEKGSASAPLINFTSGYGSGNGGIFSDANGQLNFSVASTQILGLDNFYMYLYQNGTPTNFINFYNTAGNFLTFSNGAGNSFTYGAASGQTSVKLQGAITTGSPIVSIQASSSADTTNPYLNFITSALDTWIAATKRGRGIGNSISKLNGLTVTTDADVSNIGGTTTVNASATVTGSSTFFLHDLGIRDLISVSSAASTYCYVATITNNTSLTVDDGYGGSCTLGNGTSQTINKKQAGLRVENSARAAKLTLDNNGTLSATRIVPTVVTLSDGASVALDASLGNHFRLTATGNDQISVPTNALNGQKITIIVVGSGGARTVSLTGGAGGFRFGSDITALTAVASGKSDYIGAVYNGTDSRWDIVAVTKGF